MARVITMRFGHSADYYTVEEVEPEPYYNVIPGFLRDFKQSAVRLQEWVKLQDEMYRKQVGELKPAVSIPQPSLPTTPAWWEVIEAPAVIKPLTKFIGGAWQMIKAPEAPPMIWSRTVEAASIPVEYVPTEPIAPPPQRQPTPAAVLPRQAKIGVTPEQLTRLQTEQKIRDQAIKNYLAQPLAYVWQEDKKLPGILVKTPIGKRTLQPGQAEQMFPLPTIPISPEMYQPPEEQPIYRGWWQVEGGERKNLWEDRKGNEVEGRREIAGTFGEEY